MLDIFNQDAFSVISLTSAIEHLPFVPQRIGQMGLFTFKPVTGLSVALEERDGRLVLIPPSARGTHVNMLSGSGRRMRRFELGHLQLDAAIRADDVLGVRAFGSEDQLEGVSQVVNNKLEELKQSHENTHDLYRLGALKGKVVDANGDTVYDFFDEFGLTQTEIEFDFEDADMEIKLKALEIIRAVEDALGNTSYRKIRALCGNDFFDALITHASVKEAFNRYQESAFYREDQRAGFEFPTGIVWENLRGKVGANPIVDTDKAHFIPEGVPNLFVEAFGPADFIETVNTPGQRVYAKQKIMDYDQGVQLHTQSNPLMYCERPACLVLGTMAAAEESSSEE